MQKHAGNGAHVHFSVIINKSINETCNERIIFIYKK